MSSLRWLIGAVLCCALACKHDYDALKDQYVPDIRGNGGDSGSGGVGGVGGSSGSGSGGESGSGGDPDGGAGSGGESGTSGVGGAGGMAGAEPSACEPCDPLSTEAMEAGLASCCRGLRNNTCGLAVSEDSAAMCFARDVRGEPDASCPAVGPAGNRRDGCCRPDGRCGAQFEALGLGCVAREDIPELIAPRAEAIACRLPCAQDADCGGVPDVDTVCVPQRGEPAVRYCAVSCQRDEDCDGDQVCALSPDAAENRLVAFCQEPYGDREPNEACTNANQCVHGVCLMLTGQTEATCSLFCEVPSECPDNLPFCVEARIGRPDGTGTPIAFDVCAAEDL